MLRKDLGRHASQLSFFLTIFGPKYVLGVIPPPPFVTNLYTTRPLSNFLVVVYFVYYIFCV